jgi:membrane-bound metal-dependent hydrolase YbcI (DUF457 family)
MASFRGHLKFAGSLGVAYGGLAWWQLGFEPSHAVFAAGLTALGGMLPDLDSDTGVPAREMFNLFGVVLPLMLIRRLASADLSTEQLLMVLGALYLGVRYGLKELFKRFTVHRGMFHSIPAMLTAGMITFLAYNPPDLPLRLLAAFAIMIGFLSHLLLDEVCAVDLRGLKPKLNQFAGSALKFTSKSRKATAFAYSMLLLLSLMVFLDLRPTITVAAPTASIPGPAASDTAAPARSPAVPSPP